MNKYDNARIPERLTIRNNFMFCHVMEHNPDLCKELLELILGDEIGEISSVTAEKSIDTSAISRSIRLDVYVKDGQGRIYDIEMQMTNNRDLLKRTRYYVDQIDIDNLEHGEGYESLKDTYVIFICPFNFRDSNLPRYTLEQKCIEEPDGDFSDGTKKIIICATPETIEKEERLRDFYRYIIDNVPKEGFTSRLDEAVQRTRKNPKWRKADMTLKEYAEEEARIARRAALAEGHAKGVAEGHAKGVAEGHAEGVAEGRAEGALELVKAMLASGVTAEQLTKQGVPAELIAKAQE